GFAGVCASWSARAALGDAAAESTGDLAGTPSWGRPCSPERRAGREHGAVFNGRASSTEKPRVLFNVARSSMLRTSRAGPGLRRQLQAPPRSSKRRPARGLEHRQRRPHDIEDLSEASALREDTAAGKQRDQLLA